MPTVRTYVIDAAHGADDVAVCDWNTEIGVSALTYGIDETAPGLKFVAPCSPVGFELDNTTTRAGVLFRSITVNPGETVMQAVLRLYLTDWSPPDFTDQYSGWRADKPDFSFYLIVHGAKRFPPAPGFNECPGPSAPGWGNLAAAPINVYGTGVIWDSLTAGAGGPTEWGDPHEKPGWPTGTRNWYPSRFYSLSGPDATGTGSSETMEIGCRTAARVVKAVGFGPAGYVDLDVTPIVREILAADFSVPAWSAKTYSFNDAPPGNFNTIANARPIPQVLAPNGYIYTFVGSTTGYSNNGYSSRCRGWSGASSTPPTGTVVGAEEQPDGPGTAIWRCAQNGQIRNWQTGDNLAFILLPVPEYVATNIPPIYGFPEASFPGWRTFASGDLGDATKYPTLVVTTDGADEGSLTLPAVLSLGSNGTLGVSVNPFVASFGVVADAVYQPPAFASFGATFGQTRDAVSAQVAAATMAASMSVTPDGAWTPYALHRNAFLGRREGYVYGPETAAGIAASATFSAILALGADGVAAAIGDATLGLGLGFASDAVAVASGVSDTIFAAAYGLGADATAEEVADRTFATLWGIGFDGALSDQVADATFAAVTALRFDAQTAEEAAEEIAGTWHRAAPILAWQRAAATLAWQDPERVTVWVGQERETVWEA